MQVKDQRITNIKQKYGPEFEPIMFAVKEAPGTGSIFARSSTEAEQLRLAFESVNTVSSEINAVTALPSCWATGEIRQQDREASAHPEVVVGSASSLPRDAAIHRLRAQQQREHRPDVGH